MKRPDSYKETLKTDFMPIRRIRGQLVVEPKAGSNVDLAISVAMAVALENPDNEVVLRFSGVRVRVYPEDSLTNESGEDKRGDILNRLDAAYRALQNKPDR